MTLPKIPPPYWGWLLLGGMLGCLGFGALGIAATVAREREAARHQAELTTVARFVDSLLATPCQYIPATGKCVWPMTARDTVRWRAR